MTNAPITDDETVAPSAIYFRQTFRVADLTLGPKGGAGLTVTSKTKNRTTIAIVSQGPDWYPKNNCDSFATASFSVVPSREVHDGFSALAQRRLPKGIVPGSEENWKRFMGEDGLLLPSHGLPMFGLPPRMAAFITDATAELTGGVQTAVRLLRWRHGIGGSHHPIQGVGAGAEWSLNSIEWHMVPTHNSVEFVDQPYVEATAEAQTELQRLVDSGQDEPMGHQLFREAMHQEWKNGRSALVIAVAALEVAIKGFIGTRVPHAKWLADNVQSPPIDKLLRDYIPRIPVALTIDGKVLPPPRPILRVIKGAIEMRNRIAHATGETVAHDALGQALEAIKDVIWLLDYYNGNEWAWSCISLETRASLEALAAENRVGA